MVSLHDEAQRARRTLKVQAQTADRIAQAKLDLQAVLDAFAQSVIHEGLADGCAVEVPREHESDGEAHTYAVTRRASSTAHVDVLPDEPADWRETVRALLQEVALAGSERSLG